MSYIALYRKWRPMVFEDVVEQEHVVTTLKNSVVSDRIGHAYLFCGTRGTGKTTMAKIFSRAVNCLNPKEGNPCNQCAVCRGILDGNILDVIEMDAASNNSVDNIREIKDEVVYTPSQARFKVYIIDEVHMLSTGAFNALLKTLEEPPEHVVFILATTEPHKLPATILSRCQRFDFRRISTDGIEERLSLIGKASNTSVDTGVYYQIARIAEGALRDAISILDQCLASGKDSISLKDLYQVIGLADNKVLNNCAAALVNRDIRNTVLQLDSVVNQGRDIVQFCSQIIVHFRNVMVVKLTDKPEELLIASGEELQDLKAKADNISTEELIYIIKELSSIENQLKWSSHPKILLEIAFIKICNRVLDSNATDLLEKVKILEKRIEALESNPIPYIPVESKHDFEQAEKKHEEKKPVPVREKLQKVNAVKDAMVEQWQEVINEIRDLGRMKIYMQIMDTTAVWLDDSTIGIEMDGSDVFKKAVLDKSENLEVIKDAVGRKLKKKVLIKCIIKGEDLENEASENLELGQLIEKIRETGVEVNVLDE